MLPDVAPFMSLRAGTRYHRSMASISREDVEHVAHLARLHLTDDEVDRMQAQLSNILEAIETLRDVDTSHVGPTASVIQLENVMREDEARPGLSREAALATAPLRDDPFLRVPTVLEEGR
jgi:aspartyl-tRNA(Asn)/glutamyl-tRNA(Gln) amidotransferase subunit C